MIDLKNRLSFATVKKFLIRYCVGLGYGTLLAGFIAYIPYVIGGAVAETFDPSISVEPGFAGLIAALYKLMAGSFVWAIGGALVGFFVVAIMLVPSVCVTLHKKLYDIILVLTISTLTVAFFPAFLMSAALLASLVVPWSWVHFIINDMGASIVLGWPLIGAPIGFIAGHYFLLK